MKRKLARAAAIGVVGIILYGQTAHANPITYQFGGTIDLTVLGGAFGTLSTGDTFQGVFSDASGVLSVESQLTSLVAVPEPSSILLLSMGLVGLALASTGRVDSRGQFTLESKGPIDLHCRRISRSTQPKHGPAFR